MWLKLLLCSTTPAHIPLHMRDNRAIPSKRFKKYTAQPLTASLEARGRSLCMCCWNTPEFEGKKQSPELHVHLSGNLSFSTEQKGTQMALPQQRYQIQMVHSSDRLICESLLSKRFCIFPLSHWPYSGVGFFKLECCHHVVIMWSSLL